MTDRYLIVGLGNPGREYERTRHNIGFRCVDALAATHGLTFAKRGAKSFTAEGTIAEKKVILVKPITYMNLSGEAVRPLMDFYKLPPTHLMVIMDDMDIPLGTIRIREKGSAGGQKGLKSIMEHLGTQDVPRIRFGIGRPPGRMEPSAYVLQPFGKDEEIFVVEGVDRVIKAVRTWLTDGINLMMTRHNGTAEDSARAVPAPARPAAPKPDSGPAEKAPSPTPEPEQGG
jgi:PTH1 family peptidyl-tRNA hydrolase